MNFSIITCTHNPNHNIFKRLVKAVNNLVTNETIAFEWIIVDNNSTKSVKDLPFIKEILEQHPNYCVIFEPKPGLTNARIAGIKESKYDWLVFFDDDNEPQQDYLINVSELINSFPEVTCWGPGIISVIFYGNKSNWIDKYKKIYQERRIEGENIFHEPFWREDYPQGTGQIVKKAELLDYVNKVEHGTYSMSDRSGKSLSSGGDVQIVLNTIKNGYQVGISGKLKLNHNIEESKSCFSYLFRLIYGTASSAILSQIQVFPESGNCVEITNKKVLSTLSLYFRQYKWRAFTKDKLLTFAQRMGNLNAGYLAYNNYNPKPKILKIVERIFF